MGGLKQKFISSGTFAGAKEGYDYKMGANGMGYYYKVVSSMDPKIVAAVLVVVQLHRQSQIHLVARGQSLPEDIFHIWGCKAY